MLGSQIGYKGDFVILSAQAGLYSGGAYAQHTSVAIGLARCRMTELEERMLKLGYPEADTSDDGACHSPSSPAALTASTALDTETGSGLGTRPRLR